MDEEIVLNEKIYLSDNWTAYGTSINEEVAFIKLDLDAPELLPNAVNTYVVSISNDDFDIESFFIDELDSNKIETAFEEYFKNINLECYIVGTIRQEHTFEIIFVSEVNLLNEKHISLALKKIAKSFDFDLFEDDEWAFYVNILYPSLRESSHTHNFLLCESLIAAGDDATIPRDINYSLVFKTIDDVEDFIEQLKPEYILINQPYLHNEEYLIKIKNNACPSIENMNEITNYLNIILSDIDGYLDGWSTSLEN